MTVMPSLRLSEQDAEDIATYLMMLKKQEPSSYADASFMDDPKLKDEGKKWVRHFGCAGCHEISGLEDEGRIGTELTTEGSKPIERLDFALLTETAQRGGSEPITDPDDLARLPEGQIVGIGDGLAAAALGGFGQQSEIEAFDGFAALGGQLRADAAFVFEARNFVAAGAAEMANPLLAFVLELGIVHEGSIRVRGRLLLFQHHEIGGDIFRILL